jgi:hypothetical protein
VATYLGLKWSEVYYANPRLVAAERILQAFVFTRQVNAEQALIKPLCVLEMYYHWFKQVDEEVSWKLPSLMPSVPSVLLGCSGARPDMALHPGGESQLRRNARDGQLPH